MKSKEFAAKTVDQAIEEGLKEFGVTRDRAKVEILSAGGVLKKAKVMISVSDTPGEKAKAFLEKVLNLMKVSAFVELSDEGEESLLNIVGSDTSVLLGHFGETIDSLQYLSSLVANAGGEDYRRIILDSDDYRRQREARLESIADRMAEKAVRQGYRVKLEPMNPYERRVMHARLQQNPDVTTHSEGAEPVRFLVITPKNMKAPNIDARPDTGSRSGGSGGHGRNDRNRGGRNRGYKGGAGFGRGRDDGMSEKYGVGSGGEFKDIFGGEGSGGNDGGSFMESAGFSRDGDFRSERPARPKNVSTGSLLTEKVQPKEE